MVEGVISMALFVCIKEDRCMEGGLFVVVTNCMLLTGVDVWIFWC